MRLHAMGMAGTTLPLFLVLVVVLSVPLWLAGSGKLPLPMNLPISALSAFIPALAAAIVCYRRERSHGVAQLLKTAADFRAVKQRLWYLLILALAPAIYLASYFVIRLAGRSLPDPNVPWLLAPLLFGLFYLTGAGEELGWTAYAAERLQSGWGVFKAGLFLGLIWALWHAVAFVQTGNDPSWIVWQSLKTIAMRVILVWIYHTTGKSVVAAILFHAADNVSWSLFPNYGSYYDPFVTGALTWLVAIALSLLTLGASLLLHLGRTSARLAAKQPARGSRCFGNNAFAGNLSRSHRAHACQSEEPRHFSI